MADGGHQLYRLLGNNRAVVPGEGGVDVQVLQEGIRHDVFLVIFDSLE